MMNKLAFSFCFFVLTFLFVRPICAQDIVLKSGQTIESRTLRRSGDLIMSSVQVGQSRGEVGYQVSSIARINFPEPPQLQTAASLLAENLPAKALAEIEPAVKYYAPFRDLAGNWWARAALLKVAALAGMRLDQQAEALGEEIRKNSSDPETARAARLQLVGNLVRREDFAKALALCDSVIGESTQPPVLAEAWVKKGDAFLAQRQFDAALLAYLHVPVFYENEKLWMPPALLGSARAFRGLEDLARARKSFDELAAQYPKSAQATTARAEVQKLPK